MKNNAKNKATKLTLTLVWVMRFAIGAVFITSGLVKAIDLWGFVYKIEEYLSVWNIESWRSLNFLAALAISATEFVCGLMLMLGAFRRSVVWWMLAMMVVMLPLTAYIAIADPVSDCGCFGDFLVLSNTATFLKNIIITAALIYLLVNNSKAPTIYNPYIQWIPLVISVVYILIVGLVGYNIQPLVDFRSFPPGAELLADEDSMDESDDVPAFVYEKNGVTKSFTLDNLPDSSWTFVKPEATVQSELTEFVVIEDDVNIAPEIINTEGEQMIVTIPDISRADISYTLLLNEISDYEESHGGSLICLIGSGTEGVEVWQDLSMAQYPLYPAEPTLVKELARGNMAIVCLNNGKIAWKRTLSSFSIDSASKDTGRSGIMSLIVKNGPEALLILSLLLVGLLMILAIPDIAIKITRMVRHKKHNKSQQNKKM